MPISFKDAIKVAEDNAKDLLLNARQFDLEEVTKEGHNYEVTLSYLLQGEDPYKTSSSTIGDSGSLNIGRVIAALGTRRQKKVFIISEKGEFKGFRNLKN